jgi:hypothetical protein
MFGWKQGVALVLAAVNKGNDEKVRKLESRLDLANVTITHLERQLATSQANADWLRHLANMAMADRAAIAESKGLILPNPQVEGVLRQPAEIIRGAAAGPIPTVAGDGGGAPAVVGAALADAPSVDTMIDRYAGHVGGFEDVGDELAAEMGLEHEQDGNK